VTLSVFSNLPKNNLISCLVAAIGYAFMTTGDYDADGSCVKAQAFAYDKSDFEDAINRTGSTFFDGSQPTADQLADPNWWKHYHARAELVATYTLHHMLEDNYGEAGWIRTAHTTHAIWDGGCSAWKYLLLN